MLLAVFAYRLDMGVGKRRVKNDSEYFGLSYWKNLTDQLNNDERLSGKIGYNIIELKQKVIFLRQFIFSRHFIEDKCINP